MGVILRSDGDIDFVAGTDVEEQNLDKFKARVESCLDDGFGAVSQGGVLRGPSNQREEGMRNDADRRRQQKERDSDDDDRVADVIQEGEGGILRDDCHEDEGKARADGDERIDISGDGFGFENGAFARCFLELSAVV